MRWQPIETAPKNYQTILVCPYGGLTQFAFVTWWIYAEQRWANCPYDEDELTHWLPIPEIYETLDESFNSL